MLIRVSECYYYYYCWAELPVLRVIRYVMLSVVASTGVLGNFFNVPFCPHMWNYFHCEDRSEIGSKKVCQFFDFARYI